MREVGATSHEPQSVGTACSGMWICLSDPRSSSQPHRLGPKTQPWPTPFPARSFWPPWEASALLRPSSFPWGGLWSHFPVGCCCFGTFCGGPLQPLCISNLSPGLPLPLKFCTPCVLLYLVWGFHPPPHPPSPLLRLALNSHTPQCSEQTWEVFAPGPSYGCI